MSSAVSSLPATLPTENAIGNITASAASTRRPPEAASSVSPSAECPSPLRWPISWTAMVSRSNRPVCPLGATDQGNALLKKMSDSTSSPVTTSTRKLVDASTRSSAGSLRNPSVDSPSSSPGSAAVTPPKSYVIDAVGTFCQVANARPHDVWKSVDATPGTPASVTK